MTKKKLTDKWYFTKNKKKFKYLSIAINGSCQGNCIFCYVGGRRTNIITLDFYKKIVSSAYEFGMEKIQISGGEPLLHPQFKEILKFTKEMGVEILVVTNGYSITDSIASFLSKNEINIGLSFETVDKKLNDFLNGFKGAHRLKMRAINSLLLHGYGTNNTNLNLDFIIKTFKITLPTMRDTFEFAIERGINPVIDHLIPVPPVEKRWMVIGKETKKIFDELSKVSGIKHEIPFTGNQPCNRIWNSLHVEIDGSVMICGGIQIPFYKISESNVNEWVSNAWNSQFHQMYINNIKNNLEEPCRSCPMRKKYGCIGCRAVPLFYFNKANGPDVVCWRYRDHE